MRGKALRALQLIGILLLILGVLLLAYSPFAYAQYTMPSWETRVQPIAEESFIVAPRSYHNYTVDVNSVEPPGDSPISELHYALYLKVNGSIALSVLDEEGYAAWKETGEMKTGLILNLNVMYDSGGQYIPPVAGNRFHLIFDNVHTSDPSLAKEVVLALNREAVVQVVRVESVWVGSSFIMYGLISIAGGLIVTAIGRKPSRETPIRLPSTPVSRPPRICHYCGATSSFDEVFCHRCGEKLSK